MPLACLCGASLLPFNCAASAQWAANTGRWREGTGGEGGGGGGSGGDEDDLDTAEGCEGCWGIGGAHSAGCQDHSSS